MNCPKSYGVFLRSFQRFFRMFLFGDIVISPGIEVTAPEHFFPECFQVADAAVFTDYVYFIVVSGELDILFFSNKA